MSTVVEKLSKAILNSKRTVAFTGAGISTESGIPAYRGSDGQFWGEYDSKDFYISNFLMNSGSRLRCWQGCAKFYEVIRNAHPNPAHLALAELGRMKLLRGIITQNVDGLHQKAGNRPSTVVEIHGTAHSISCLDCGRKYDCNVIYSFVVNQKSVPYCEYCQGILKMDTIFPGEEIIPNVASRTLRMLDSANLLIVIGCSLETQPAAYLPVKAREVGAKVAIINLSYTRYDKYADYIIRCSAGPALSEILKHVRLCATTTK